MAELIKKLGYRTSHGKNYETVQNRLDELKISTEHFTSKTKPAKRTEENVFCENSTAAQTTLRRFYLKQENIKYQCSECGHLGEWNGKPLSLQLDHKDGDNTNNKLDNLRWLCPNCHSQTKTFAGRNQQASTKTNKYNTYRCLNCGKEVTRKSNRCKTCAQKQIKKIRPTRNELKNILQAQNGNFTKVSMMCSVSTTTVRRWCEELNLSSKSKDYKQKIVVEKKESTPPCAVEQVDIDSGNVISTFNSIKEAEKITGIYHISQASNPQSTRKTAGGYIWRRKQ